MHKARQLVKFMQSKRHWQFEVVFLLTTLAVAAICLSPLYRRPGYPQNHEYLNSLERTAIYADHFRQGDIFPIWASSDAFGMGTPLPLFYHKTFYYVSGFVYLISGSMKGAIATALVLFMLVGAYGMRFCIAKLSKRPVFLVLGPQTFLLSHYAFTDWLGRGATAEFTAMMFLPWLIWWCLKLLREKLFSFAIAPILFFIIESHNVTALFAIVLLAVASGIFLLTTGLSGLWQTWKPGLLSIGLLGVLLFPQILLQKIFLTDYDPSKVIQSGFTASNNFKPAAWYFVDSSFVWLKDWKKMTVQIDYGIWLVLVGIICAIVLCLLVRRSATVRYVRKSLLQPATVFLTLTFAAFLALQFRFTNVLYEHIPFMEYLQFPWRLLAYITPLGILLVIAAVTNLRVKRALAVATVAWVASFLIFSPVTHKFQFAFFPPQTVRDNTTLGHPQLTGPELAGIGEYYPRVFDAQGTEQGTYTTVYQYERLSNQQKELQVLSGTCSVVRLPQRSLETGAVRFRYTCDFPSLIALPVSFSRVSYVTNDVTHERVIRFRHPDDPRMLVHLKPGSGLLTVHLPSVGTAWKLLLQR